MSPAGLQPRLQLPYRLCRFSPDTPSQHEKIEQPHRQIRQRIEKLPLELGSTIYRRQCIGNGAPTTSGDLAGNNPQTRNLAFSYCPYYIPFATCHPEMLGTLLTDIERVIGRAG